MNFDFYLFGTPDGYNQYPWDDKEILFQSFYDKTIPVQLTIYRKAELVYYSYVRNLKGNSRQYFGMIIVINGKYLSNLKEVFAFFDNLYYSIVNKGQLLGKDAQGKVGFRCSQFVDFPAEIESVERDCRVLLEGWYSKSQTRLPEEYVVQNREIGFAFDSEILPVKLDDLLKYYNRIYLTKGKAGNILKDPSTSGTKPKWGLFVIVVLILVLLIGAFLYFNPIKKDDAPPPPEQPEITVSNEKQSSTFDGQMAGNQDAPTSLLFAENDTASSKIECKESNAEQPKPRTGPSTENPKQPKPRTESPTEKPKPEEKQPKPSSEEHKPDPKPQEEPVHENNVRNVTNLEFSEGYYTGTLCGNMIEGKGTFVYTSGDFAGDKFEGEWKNNKFDGYGVYTCNPQNTDYIKLEGYWKNGKMNGEGVCYFKNGDRYEGGFVNGQPDGVGKYYSANGERHEGLFKNGLPNGQGRLYYSNGKLKYEGEFKNGLFDGVGTYYFSSGSVYNGLFKNGEKVK